MHCVDTVVFRPTVGDNIFNKRDFSLLVMGLIAAKNFFCFLDQMRIEKNGFVFCLSCSRHAPLRLREDYARGFTILLTLNVAKSKFFKVLFDLIRHKANILITSLI